MSAVKIIRTLLVDHAPLLAVVPAARIMAGVLPQGMQLPALALTEISTVPVGHIDAQAPSSLVRSRVQVTVIASSYPLQKQLLPLVRQACNYQRGVLAGFPVVSVQFGSNGPDFNDQETAFYMQTIDFIVTFFEPN